MRLKGIFHVKREHITKNKNSEGICNKMRLKSKKLQKIFGTMHFIYYFCTIYENRYYHSITRDAGRILQ